MGASDFKPGDILGFSGDGWLSAGINLATFGIPFWGLSHVGIVGERRGELLIFESTTKCDLPCAITGRRFDGTQAHAIDDRIADYRGKVWHYPLCRPLFQPERNRLREFLTRHIGTPYSAIGAFRAGECWSWIESCLRDTDLTSIFCSEYCAAAHCIVGLFPTGNAGRWNPNRFCRQERWHGILCRPHRLK